MLALFLVTGCNRSTPPGQLDAGLLSGRHALVEFQGKRLPAKLIDIPASQGGPPSGCFVEVRDGYLDLAISNGRGTFVYQYRSFNSCTDQSVGETVWGGQAEAIGNALALRRVGVDGVAWDDTARVDASRIRIEGVGLSFVR